ncbi:hypothetical protein [Thermohalobacter berrensis]|nr:hypothetical protein [Thermohalobacter berrensis]
MLKVIYKKRLYLFGKIDEILAHLNEMTNKYSTIKEVIDSVEVDGQ